MVKNNSAKTNSFDPFESRFFNFSSLFSDESSGLQEPPEYLLSLPPPLNRLYRIGRHHLNKRSTIKCGCGIKKHLPKLEAALDVNGQWRFIVNETMNKSKNDSTINVELCGSVGRQFFISLKIQIA